MDGPRRSRAGVALVAMPAVVLALAGVLWVHGSAASAARYADRIDAGGVAPYAPDGWTADDVGSWRHGRLRYDMHDGAGRDVAVTVRRAAGREPGLMPYQRRLREEYGVVIDIRPVRDPDPDGMALSSAVAAGMTPRDPRWLADRGCWSCRFARHLIDAGILFG